MHRASETPASSRLQTHDGEDDTPMWLCRFPLGEPGGWGFHHHRQHQIAWVAQGMTTASVDGRQWVLTPNRAMWIPGNASHDLVNRRDALLYCLYVWPDRCPVDWNEPTVLAVSPLARELLIYLGTEAADAVEAVGVGADTIQSEVSAAAATMLFAQLEPLSQAGVALPMPVDDRAAELASALLACPSNQDTLECWAAKLATSISTLRRAFVAETGLTFSEWRAQARLLAALPLLADRMSVTRVALQVGYSSPSGFVSAFRRQFGHTPGTYHERATALIA